MKTLSLFLQGRRGLDTPVFLKEVAALFPKGGGGIHLGHLRSRFRPCRHMHIGTQIPALMLLARSTFNVLLFKSRNEVVSFTETYFGMVNIRLKRHHFFFQVKTRTDS